MYPLVDLGRAGIKVREMVRLLEQAVIDLLAAHGVNSTCKAGLLNTSRSNQLICDSDPSQSGQQLLAHTVQQAYAMATSHPPTRG